MDLTKPCKKCGSTDRYKSGKCRPCQKARNAAFRASTPNYKTTYNADHREEIAVYNASYNAAHHEEKATQYADRKERGLCVKCGEPAKTNRILCVYCGNKHSSAVTKRQQTHLPTRLAMNLRTRLRMAIKNSQKAGSAVRDLGCTIPELTVYLEKLFQPGMSWENHNKKGWHIDHIKPLASFDLTNRQQFLEANHYTNLQPLWAEDNLKKGDKVSFSSPPHNP